MTAQDITALYEKCAVCLEPILPQLGYAPTLFYQISALERLIGKCEKNQEAHKAELLKHLKKDLESLVADLREFLSVKKTDPILEEEDLYWLVFYLAETVRDTSTSHDIPIDDYIVIYSRGCQKGILDEGDQVMFLSWLIFAYGKTRYYWRGRGLAEKLDSLLNGMIPHEETQDGILEAYRTLSDFYFRVSDIARSYAYADRGASLAYECGDLELSEELTALAIKRRAVFPSNLRPPLDKERLRMRFPERADDLLLGEDKPSLKHDPVEHSEAFLLQFDEVMEAVERKIDREGDLHLPYQRWQIMQEELEKRGILWRNPAIMNPGNTFS